MNDSRLETTSQQRSIFDSIAALYSGKQLRARPHQVKVLVTLALSMAIVFVLTACSSSAADDLSGTSWELATLSGGDLIAGTTITLEFSEDALSGSAGCNHYGGSYQLSGRSLVLSDIFSTEMACPEPAGVLEQETAYLGALNNADSYEIDGQQLAILDESGGQSLVFVARAAGSNSQAEAPAGQADGDTVVTQNATQTPEPTATLEATDEPPSPTPSPEPTATAEVVEEPTTTPADPPPGFKPYVDATTGVTLYVPESWFVTPGNPDQWAILQSYPEDKYVGGGGFQPGDTKCDLNIQPPGTSVAGLIQEWKSNPDTTVVSEQEIVLDSGMTGIRLEIDNRGRSLSMFIDAQDQAVVLTCYGDFTPFDEIAATLRAAE